MQYREMERIHQKVSALGFSVMRLAGSGRRIPLGLDERKAMAANRRAVELGINYFYTAYLYHLGASERTLGLALRDGLRQKVLIADKLPIS